MTASIPATHPAFRGWQEETESPPSFLWLINVSAKCMCLIATSSDSLLPVVSVKPFSSLVGILSDPPVTLSFTLWTQLMHVELCDTCTGALCSPWSFESSCFPLRTQLSTSSTLFSGSKCRFLSKIFYKDVAPHVSGLNQQESIQRTQGNGNKQLLLVALQVFE